MVAPLTLAIWTPIFFSILLICFTNYFSKKILSAIAISGGLLSFLITVPILMEFNYESVLFSVSRISSLDPALSH